MIPRVTYNLWAKSLVKIINFFHSGRVKKYLAVFNSDQSSWRPMKALRYIIPVILFFLLANCQTEERILIQDEMQGFAKYSPLVSLLSRTAQNPTAHDNVLDNSSLISIQLPVTVIVNGITIPVATTSDYQLVQNAIDAYATDNDIVNFNYPIVIQLQNYSTQTISSYNQLQNAIAACGTDDNFDEIDCISISYPITVSLYNIASQSATSLTLTGNSSLYAFLANLSASVYVAVDYPISLVNPNGQTVVVNSNIALMNFIEDSIDDCSNISGSSGSTIPTLSQVLVNGSWFISYCVYDGTNETNYYQGYLFDYSDNGTITVQKNSATVAGDWDINDENGYQRLSLNFDGSSLHDLETNWRVIEYSETILKLKEQNSDHTDYLTFTKN